MQTTSHDSAAEAQTVRTEPARSGLRPTGMLARLGGIVAAAMLAAVPVLMVGAAPAQASCVSGDPPRSPYAFIGVVVATSSRDRVATVRTEDRRTIEVRGTEAPG